MSVESLRAPSPLTGPNLMQRMAPWVVSASTLLGVSGVLNAPPAHAQQQQLSPEEKERIKQDVRKQLPTAEVWQLLKWMDSPIFDVREMSTKELRVRVASICKETGKLPEEIAQYKEKRRTFPPEVRNRLDHLSSEFEQFELAQKFGGTKVTFPKRQMKVSEWLACLSKQLDRAVNLYGLDTLRDEIIETEDGTVWDVIAKSKLKNGMQFSYHSSNPIEVALHIRKREGRVIATDGAFSAQLDTEIGDFRFMMEPKYAKQSFRISAVRQRDTKGKMHRVEAGDVEHVTLPVYVSADEPFYAEYDIQVQAYGTQKFTIEDPTKDTTIKANGYTFAFKGLRAVEDGWKHIASLEAPPDCPDEVREGIQCSFAENGEQEISVHDTSYEERSVVLGFRNTTPQRITFFIPNEKPDQSMPRRKVTLVFERK